MMLYLIRPDLSMEWADVPGIRLEQIPTDTDLGDIPGWWEQAERRATTEALRVALRYGRATSRGIAVDAHHISTVERPAELAHIALAADSAHQRIAPTADALAETLGADMGERKRIDRDYKASVAAGLEEAEAEAQEELSSPPNEHLVRHWARLGGPTPNPL